MPAQQAICEDAINFDLHMHSTASDGSLSPQALVDTAANAGVTCMALTDHDTMQGLDEARIAANERGVHFLSGVEISVTWRRRTLHIVGLGVATDAPALIAGLSRLQTARGQRAHKIAEKLETLGVCNAHARARQAAQSGQITRTHFARLLIEDGKCVTMQQAFKRWLRPGKPAYVNADWAGLVEAVGWIHQAGGVAVLAHPLAYGMTAAWRARMLQAFTEAGGDALEVHCGNSGTEDIRLSAKAALEYRLMGSVGSDFHAPEQRWLKLGRPLPLPPEVTPVWRDPRLGLG